jgi:hypothetical protein
MIFQTKYPGFCRHTAPKNIAQLKIKFGDRKIIGKCGYESVCNKSYGALRTFMQNNPFFWYTLTVHLHRDNFRVSIGLILVFETFQHESIDLNETKSGAFYSCIYCEAREDKLRASADKCKLICR